MAKNSSIEWTHHTFNPWWGCAKVSPACDHCYAEAWAKRVGEGVWGRNSDRRFFGDKHWSEPLKWNQEAKSAGQRRRVFCASMADVFEQRRDLDPEREKLWQLIQETPWLDWLLLTKRIESAWDTVPWDSVWPHNVWIGTTVENQHWAMRRIAHLVRMPAARRFLSCEPLLGPLDLAPWIGVGLFPVDWVIAGGESGAKARPMNPTWARNLRDQCQSAGIAFLFKQWGHWAPAESSGEPPTMEPKGKKKAGRLLDGATWDQIPATL